MVEWDVHMKGVDKRDKIEFWDYKNNHKRKETKEREKFKN